MHINNKVNNVWKLLNAKFIYNNRVLPGAMPRGFPLKKNTPPLDSEAEKYLI